jgi:hypothetical protein
MELSKSISMVEINDNVPRDVIIRAIELAFEEIESRRMEIDKNREGITPFEDGCAEAFWEALEIINNRLAPMNESFEE